MHVADIRRDLKTAIEAFGAGVELRTCRRCGYVQPERPSVPAHVNRREGNWNIPSPARVSNRKGAEPLNPQPDASSGDAMDRHGQSRPTRREVLQAALALPATFVLASRSRQTPGGGSPEAFAAEPLLPPTPACADADDLTPSQTEGPFFKRRSPERTSLLEPGITGTPIVLTGYVLSRRCRPMARALLDFWQADAQGNYDNAGYRLRGHQFADDAGRYRLHTVVPGLYPGRTRHIHVKVQAPNRPILTTQLYFPDEPRNARDGIFNPALLVSIQDAADGKLATFNFILDLA